MLKFEFNIFYCFFDAKFYIDYLRAHTGAQKLLLMIEFYLIHYSLYNYFIYTKTFILFNF